MTAFLLLALLAWSDGPADDMADALKALDDRHPEIAEPLLRKVVAADAGDFSAHFNLALALSLQQKDAEAIAELRRTLELKPGLYEAQSNLGILLLRNQRAAEALPLLRAAAEARPKETRPQLYYAQALLETGDAAAARERYMAVVAVDPNSSPAHSGAARALLREAKLPEAAAQFRAAGDAPGLLAVAAEFEKAGRMDEAMAIYKELPDDPAVRERLGRLQVDRQDSAAAIPNLEEAVRARPTTANRLALADAYKLGKQPAKMLEQLQLAAAAEPGSFDIHMALGRALRDQRRMMPAAQQFAAAAKLDPASAPAWNELASALIIDERYVEGLAALDRLRALGKEIPGDLYLRAITLDKLKQRPQALAAYQSFLAASKGAFPDQEFLARQRVRIIENELRKK